jgi:hypothetical protein
MRELVDGITARCEAGTAEALGEWRFVPVLELPSGARLALSLTQGGGDGAVWLSVEEGRVTAFAPGSELGFVEPLEQPRAAFESALEEGALAAGLPGEAALFSFPVLELARALLARGQPYFSRLVLLWLLPSELRPLRREIAAVAANDELPAALRDLARRLVVPE